MPSGPCGVGMVGWATLDPLWVSQLPWCLYIGAYCHDVQRTVHRPSKRPELPSTAPCVPCSWAPAFSDVSIVGPIPGTSLPTDLAGFVARWMRTATEPCGLARRPSPSSGWRLRKVLRCAQDRQGLRVPQVPEAAAAGSGLHSPPATSSGQHASTPSSVHLMGYAVGASVSAGAGEGIVKLEEETVAAGEWGAAAALAAGSAGRAAVAEGHADSGCGNGAGVDESIAANRDRRQLEQARAALRA